LTDRHTNRRARELLDLVDVQVLLTELLKVELEGLVLGPQLGNQRKGRVQLLADPRIAASRVSHPRAQRGTTVQVPVDRQIRQRTDSRACSPPSGASSGSRLGADDPEAESDFALKFKKAKEKIGEKKGGRNHTCKSHVPGKSV
jgi:hypothetical protein